MALITLKTMLDKACQKRYAVGAFIVVNLSFLEAIILAARHTASPAVLNITEVHFPFVTNELI
jgi:fructose/tagatose bisphosphate aldolase